MVYRNDWRGIAWYKTGCYEQALKEIQRALELDPDNAATPNSMGIIFYAMGRYEQAVKEKQRESEPNPHNAEHRDS